MCSTPLTLWIVIVVAFDNYFDFVLILWWFYYVCMLQRFCWINRAVLNVPEVSFFVCVYFVFLSVLSVHHAENTSCPNGHLSRQTCDPPLCVVRAHCLVVRLAPFISTPVHLLELRLVCISGRELASVLLLPLLTWEHQSWVTDLQMWTVPNCTQSALFKSEQ